jgi:hypothetical protein
MVTTVIGHTHAGWMFWIGDGECDEATARHFSGANFCPWWLLTGRRMEYILFNLSVCRGTSLNSLGTEYVCLSSTNTGGCRRTGE